MIEATGAPRDQGWVQGRALRRELQAAARAVSGRLQREVALSVRRSLPQQHERLAGIAAGAGLSLESLERLSFATRVRGSAQVDGPALVVAFTPEPSVGPACVRRSVPDVGGFPTVEITAAPWAGCLAGVNSEGIAVACLNDGGLDVPPLRLLCQDILLRTRTHASAVEHLRRRAPYLRADGVVVLVAATGEAVSLRLDRGVLSTAELPVVAGTTSSVSLDAASRTLDFDGRKISADPGG